MSLILELGRFSLEACAFMLGSQCTDKPCAGLPARGPTFRFALSAHAGCFFPKSLCGPVACGEFFGWCCS